MPHASRSPRTEHITLRKVRATLFSLCMYMTMSTDRLSPVMWAVMQHGQKARIKFIWSQMNHIALPVMAPAEMAVTFHRRLPNAGSSCIRSAQTRQNSSTTYRQNASPETGMMPKRNDHRLPRTWLQLVPAVQPMSPCPLRAWTQSKAEIIRAMAHRSTIAHLKYLLLPVI